MEQLPTDGSAMLFGTAGVVVDPPLVRSNRPTSMAAVVSAHGNSLGATIATYVNVHKTTVSNILPLQRVVHHFYFRCWDMYFLE